MFNTKKRILYQGNCEQNVNILRSYNLELLKNIKRKTLFNK